MRRDKKVYFRALNGLTAVPVSINGNSLLGCWDSLNVSLQVDMNENFWCWLVGKSEQIYVKRKKREVGNGKGWHELFISACGRRGLKAEPKSAVFMNSLMKCWCLLWSANQVEIKVKESLSSTFCYACTIVVIRKT